MEVPKEGNAPNVLVFKVVGAAFPKEGKLGVADGCVVAAPNENPIH